MVARSSLRLLGLVAVLFASSRAVAAPGRVVLVGGQVIAGEIERVVEGDYVVVKLADGESKAIAWADVASMTFDVQPGAASTMPVPPPPPVYVSTTPAAYPPPPIEYPPPPPPRFEPAWTLGVRLGTMVVGGNVYGDDHHDWHDDHSHGPELRMTDVASWGWMVEGDAGYHFSPSWTVYGFWEHGELDHGDFNVSSWGYTNAVGIGVNANTAPYDPVGFYFDVGASYRWMTFTQVTLNPAVPVHDRATVEGFDFLRVAIGASIQVSRKLRFDPHVYTSSGYFTRFHDAACPGGCSSGGRGVDVGYHVLSGLAVTARFDL